VVCRLCHFSPHCWSFTCTCHRTFLCRPPRRGKSGCRAYSTGGPLTAAAPTCPVQHWDFSWHHYHTTFFLPPCLAWTFRHGTGIRCLRLPRLTFGTPGEHAWENPLYSALRVGPHCRRAACRAHLVKRLLSLRRINGRLQRVGRLRLPVFIYLFNLAHLPGALLPRLDVAAVAFQPMLNASCIYNILLLPLFATYCAADIRACTASARFAVPLPARTRRICPLVSPSPTSRGGREETPYLLWAPVLPASGAPPGVITSHEHPCRRLAARCSLH